MLKVTREGTFDNLEKSLKNMSKIDYRQLLNRYGEEGVLALSAATPVDTGKSAGAWRYVVENKGSRWSITWTNDNTHQGIPIVLLIQYGHATGNGGYIQGRDFINPALRPVFDKLASAVWKEVSK